MCHLVKNGDLPIKNVALMGFIRIYDGIPSGNLTQLWRMAHLVR